MREDEAIAMAAGAICREDSRRTHAEFRARHCLNTLISLNMMYRHPCILLVSWRGFQGNDAPEHLVMGETMLPLLDTMKIPLRILSEQTMTDDLRWVGQTFMKQRIPLVLAIKKNIVKGLHP